ncbi:MAG: 2-oxo acid dehydrogenase subunit E2 [Verrucomicrobiota bacterium]|nr:2-oxo acid dehydrogenase subunit E2 [Verrucomicrobiota bacterium]MEE2724935.1 2-oxo acid dehydrogenase subunit E2 [Verrucomicrobiota bacterium]|tara:strand:+ start:8295 stop:9503 length:1209 start_codon:yes stop_codon:yes gene_type:complete
MRVPILMPQLGESIAEATVRDIKIEIGQQVTADEDLLEVETEKAMMEVTTPCPGKILEIIAEVDISYPVGATLGYLEATEEYAEKNLQIEETFDSEEEQSNFAESNQIDANEPNKSLSVTPTIEGLPVPAKASGAKYISPRLRARMEELGLNTADLAGIAGSGAGGRVTVEDFESFMHELETKKTSPASSMRIAVADSMRRSWSRPLATVGSPVKLDSLLEHRKSSTPKPGPTIYAIRALALALSERTASAGRLVGNQIIHPDSIDIGFAVEVDDGVLVPVIRKVDQIPLKDLVGQYSSLVDAAKKRRLPKEASTPPGIATVTNFGTFGIVWATPIPLPEQNIVLGLGFGQQKPSWDKENECWTPVVEAELTLSFDHRILDGGGAGRLLSRIAELLQSPEDL